MQSGQTGDFKMTMLYHTTQKLKKVKTVLSVVFNLIFGIVKVLLHQLTFTEVLSSVVAKSMVFYTSFYFITFIGPNL